MLLQDPHAIPPVLSVEVITVAVLGPRRSWAPIKGEGALGFSLWGIVTVLFLLLFNSPSTIYRLLYHGV